MKEDEKETPKGASGEAKGDPRFDADEPTDMEIALRCIKLLEDLGSKDMPKGILETIRSIKDQMTNPYARKLVEERLREFTDKQEKNPVE